MPAKILIKDAYRFKNQIHINGDIIRENKEDMCLSLGECLLIKDKDSKSINQCKYNGPVFIRYLGKKVHRIDEINISISDYSGNESELVGLFLEKA